MPLQRDAIGGPCTDARPVMLAADASRLMPSAGSRLQVDHAKDVNHELASHSRVLPARVHDQGQRAEQPDSVDADLPGQAKL